jgi:hypothetical protein
MFATKKPFYLIVDTCTLHHCSDLIRAVVWASYLNKLKFVVIIPTIVIRELKQQEVCMQGLHWKSFCIYANDHVKLVRL